MYNNYGVSLLFIYLGMANLIDFSKPKPYYNSRVWPKYDEWKAMLAASKWVYIGNLSFYTTESQIHALFSRIGSVRRVILGRNKHDKTPCGFGFVEYTNHDDCLQAVSFLSNSKLDDRIIKVELDPGYEDGRQWGRSRDGGIYIYIYIY